jgi:ribosomal protein S18 acetylase RimI-like enzyme
MPNMVYVLIGTAAAAVLAFNMSYSIRVTFPPKLNISATVCDAVALAGEKSQTRNSNILVRQSQRGDEPALARLISDNFGYIFSAVFDTSPRMTKKILLSMLRAANGRIPNFGFRSFEVACDGNSAEVLGLLNSACSKPLSTALVYWPLIPAIILYHLGLYGLIRSWNNWNVIRDTVPEFAPDELYIQYIAVNTQFQGIGIGSRLLSRVYELCISAEKTKVVLDVRESNQKARDFFRSQGFREDMLISRFSDQVLGKGQTIRMVHNISATVSLS